jgi:hypothetical protein
MRDNTLTCTSIHILIKISNQSRATMDLEKINSILKQNLEVTARKAF